MSKTKITLGIIIIIIAIIAIGIIIAQNKGAEGLIQNATSTPSQTASTTAEYTLADVATHNSQQSCWSAINGKVYDLTTWIGKHPGGERAILSICGKDGSSAFNGQHGSDPRAQSVLPNFLIGSLK